jgi:RNAse (barnase) inhibitor barstar
MIDDLTKLKEPYFHLIVAEKCDFLKFYSTYNEIDVKNLVVKFINANKIATLDEFFCEFAKALDFPNYFGHNWAAFDECLNDLDWLPSNSYLLLLSDANQLMSILGDSFQTLIEILSNAIKEWTEGRNYDDFPTPPTPFHIVFQCSKDNLNEVKPGFKAIGVDKIDIINI